MKSVSCALEVLSCFAIDYPEWGVTELAEYLGIYKSAAHRYLRELQHAGFVQRTSSRRYRIGVRALELGNVYRYKTNLLVGAEGHLVELAERNQSTVHLGQLDRNEVFDLFRVAGHRSTQLTRCPRPRMPAHSTALGKVLLANKSDSAFRSFIGLRKALTQFTPMTITDPSKLYLEAQRVAREGYAVDNEEMNLGKRCFGVPVRDRSGRVIAAISISDTVEKFCQPYLPRIISQLIATADAIARETDQQDLSSVRI